MTNVSKHPLGKDLEEKLFAQLVKLFSDTGKKQLGGLFSSLLSPSERIMLVKRLSVVIFLEQGLSSYQVAKNLKMSESSVNEIRRTCDTGRFDLIIKEIDKSTFDAGFFLETVEKILHLGFLPSRTGKRWQVLNKIGTTAPKLRR